MPTCMVSGHFTRNLCRPRSCQYMANMYWYGFHRKAVSLWPCSSWRLVVGSTLFKLANVFFFCLFPVSRTSNTAPTMVPSGYVKTGNSCWRLHWCRWSGMISVVVLRMPSRWPRPGGMNPTNHGLQLQSATCSTQRQLKFYVGFLISVFQHSYTRTCSDIQAIRLGCVTGWVPKNRDWSHTVLTIL